MCEGESNCESLHSNNIEVENFNKDTFANKKRTHKPSTKLNYILSLQIIPHLQMPHDLTTFTTQKKTCTQHL
jgi:hypothetical protein